MDSNIEKIIEAISQEARDEVDRISENSRKNVDEIEKLYEKEAALDRDEIMGKAEREVGEVRQRSRSQMGMETRNIRLDAKRRIMEKVFARAEEKLASLPDDQRKTLYERLIKKYSSSGQVVVQMNERDGRMYRQKLSVPGIVIKYDEEVGSFLGGVIIKEGDVEISCTFEALVKEAKQARETEIAQMLFS